MCWRIIGPASMSRLRIPGVCSSRRSIASATVAASTSVERWVPGISDTRERGRITVAIGGASVESHGLDAPDRRQVLGEAGPALALVGRAIQLARARPEEDPNRIEPIDRQRLAVHTDECVLLREAVAVALPAVGPIACPPDSERSARSKSAFLGMAERDHPAGVRVSRVCPEHEPELGAQALADVLPALRAVGRSEHAAMVLLVEAVGLARRHCELVDALPRLGVRIRREAGQHAAVARLPGRAAVLGGERPDSADRHPHLLGVGGVGDDRVAYEAAGARLPAGPARVFAQTRDMAPVSAAV